MKELDEIGKGGFGIVHEVVDDNGTHYARKTYASTKISQTPLRQTHYFALVFLEKHGSNQV